MSNIENLEANSTCKSSSGSEKLLDKRNAFAVDGAPVLLFQLESLLIYLIDVSMRFGFRDLVVEPAYAHK